MPQVVARKYLRDRHFNNFVARRRAEHGVGAARTPMRAGTPPSTVSAAVCSTEIRRNSSTGELGRLARPDGVEEISAGLDEIAAEFEGWDRAAPRAFATWRPPVLSGTLVGRRGAVAPFSRRALLGELVGGLVGRSLVVGRRAASASEYQVEANKTARS